MSGWQRIKDFVHDPAVGYYLVIAVGRPLDIARYVDGRFIDHDHRDRVLEPLYFMPVPDTPQELNQWFYGEPNGYRLRTQPPWESKEKWNGILTEEQEQREKLEMVAPIGSRVKFKTREGKKIGTVEGNSAGFYQVNDEATGSLWCSVEPAEILKIISRPVNRAELSKTEE